MTLPNGYVDPADSPTVAAVLGATHRQQGIDGVLDLLRRLPGVRHDPGRKGRLFAPAVPPSTWLGPENQVVLSDPPELAHVVGGVVLQRTPLTVGSLPAELARAIAQMVRELGGAEDASAVLTAARDVADRG